MIDSYSRISFSPERRGEQDYQYYTELLKNDLESLGEKKGNYEQKFIDKVMLIYHRQSNCTSSFIVGPANYHLGRHEKAWDSRDKAYSDFEYWRTKYFKAVNRKRTLSPEQELDKLPEEIDRLTFRKEKAKEFNKLKDKQSEQGRAILLEMYPHWNDEQVNDFLAMKNPCFYITNMTTKIRERKKKLEVMKVRIKRKESFENIQIPNGKIYIENDRVIVKHDIKPSKEVIGQIRYHGFRYAPSFTCWVRKHTGNAIYSARQLATKLNELGSV